MVRVMLIRVGSEAFQGGRIIAQSLQALWRANC